MSEKFDVVIVGAGPAGSTAALVLARAGMKVALFERGQQPGDKNMFGGALFFTEVLQEMLPDFWQQAPIERYVTRHILTFMTSEASFSADFHDTSLASIPYNGVTLLRAKFDPWYADLARQAGALLVPATVVNDLLWEGDRITGVVTGRDGGEVHADVVIVADGANSLLAKKAGLRKEFLPDSFAVAAKEVLALPPETINERFSLEENEGIAQSFIGDCTGGLPGGAFLYTNRSSLSLGLVVRLSALQKAQTSITVLFDSFKNSPAVRRIIKDAVLKEYSGHLIPEAGLTMVPELYDNGIMVAGDAAGFLVSTGLTLQGMNFAIASGYAAAQAAISAGEKGDFSSKGLAAYRDILEQSFVLKDMQTFRHAPAFQENPRLYETYPELICGISRKIFTVDGKPGKKILPLVREEMRGKVSFRQALKDIMQAGRALIWR